jgi:hypothetical protein
MDRAEPGKLWRMVNSREEARSVCGDLRARPKTVVQRRGHSACEAGRYARPGHEFVALERLKGLIGAEFSPKSLKINVRVCCTLAPRRATPLSWKLKHLAKS